jgi:hypothetical protein
MDLALTALFSLATGAVASAVVSAFFANKADKRRTQADAERWLRERRYEVYRGFLVEADFLNLGLQRDGDGKFSREAMTKAGHAVSAVALIGPQSIYDAAVNYQNVAKEELERVTRNQPTDWNALVLARSQVGLLMQEKIGVPPKERVGLSEETQR